MLLPRPAQRFMLRGPTARCCSHTALLAATLPFPLPSALALDARLTQGSPFERNAYEALQGSPLQLFAPCCYRAVNRGAQTLLYMEDLTAAYAEPCVMDVKMGTRTFQEKEADNPKRRLDLVEKMRKVDASALTADEHKHGVTKLRYMQFREALSSSATHGWRIEGMHVSGHGKVEIAKTMREHGALLAALSQFVQGQARTARQLEGQLCALRDALQSSTWFMQHEVLSPSGCTRSNQALHTPVQLLACISTSRHVPPSHAQVVSSSLLVVYDAATPPMAAPGIWMIDFAHVNPLPTVGTMLTHRDAWQKGNHEEGYLFGLDNLLATFDELSGILEKF